MEPSLYARLPEDWAVGIADIVESTKAIADRRYKAVNMAGAAVIASGTNALEGREFPFAFGGGGAGFAFCAAGLPPARARLGPARAWAEWGLGPVVGGVRWPG